MYHYLCCTQLGNVQGFWSSTYFWLAQLYLGMYLASFLELTSVLPISFWFKKKQPLIKHLIRLGVSHQQHELELYHVDITIPLPPHVSKQSMDSLSIIQCQILNLDLADSQLRLTM
jgi:hypothetical protein